MSEPRDRYPTDRATAAFRRWLEAFLAGAPRRKLRRLDAAAQRDGERARREAILARLLGPKHVRRHPRPRLPRR